jgi:hypothetical protein
MIGSINLVTTGQRIRSNPLQDNSSLRHGLGGGSGHRKWLLIWLIAGLGSMVARELHAQANRAQTMRYLEARKKQQVEAAGQFKAFRDFQFTDRREESDIRFENRVVDDAGKNWKPAHYDHGNGIAAADVDGDGREDIYFLTQLGACQLWRNLGGGKFEDITGNSGPGLKDQIAVAAAFADIDNDGDPDLFVTTVRHGNHLFENVGGGRFKDITKEAGVEYVGHSSGAVFLDFDNDGLLDLLVCNVGVYTAEQKGRGGFYLALTNAFAGHLFPERIEYKILYRNLGAGKFKDVTAAMGLRDGSWSGDVTFCDLNGDRFPDVYLANMQGDDHFYENVQGQKFVERTADYFPKTPWGAMGVTFFDYNNDGLMDLFVTDMHSDMTDDQTRQTKGFPLQLEKEKSERFCAVQWTDEFLQGASNNIFGNAFYENRGDGKFVERSDALGAETYWPWGPSASDLNADGFEDLFVAAGMGYPFRYAINSVLLNERGQRFFDSEFLLGVEPRARGRIVKTYFTLYCQGEDKDHPLCQGQPELPVQGALSTRSAVLFDLDDDGDVDIVTSEFNDFPQVLVSNLAERRKVWFLKIRLEGTHSNRDGLGAMVQVRAGSQTFTRFHNGKSGYLSQSALPLYFGLGNAGKIDSIQVHWPSGTRQVLSTNLPLNVLIKVKEPR